jgi:hypothetical protein
VSNRLPFEVHRLGGLLLNRALSCDGPIGTTGMGAYRTDVAQTHAQAPLGRVPGQIVHLEGNAL